MIKPLLILTKKLSDITLNAAALSMGVLACLVFYQVLTRFIFNSPSELSEALSRMIMVWMVYLTMSCTFHRGSMIAIDFFITLLPKAIGVWGRRITTLIILFFLAILIYTGIDLAIQVESQNIALLNISAFWMYLSIPVGAVLAVPAVIEWHLVNVEDIPEFHELRESLLRNKVVDLNKVEEN